MRDCRLRCVLRRNAEPLDSRQMETEIESNNKKMKRSNWNLITLVESKKDALSKIRESFRYIQTSQNQTREGLKVYYCCKSHVECQNMRRYDKINDNQYNIYESGTSPRTQTAGFP